MEIKRKLPYRNSIRLKGYDYSKNGAYFITLCELKRRCVFGEIIKGEMKSNSLGKIIEEKWIYLKERYSYVDLDSWVVMPNHFHGLLVIKNRNSEKVKPLGSLIGAFKTMTTRYVNEINQTPGKKLWQRNYWEHIVRNEFDFNRIQNYIINNPKKWEIDKLNSKNKNYM